MLTALVESPKFIQSRKDVTYKTTNLMPSFARRSGLGS